MAKQSPAEFLKMLKRKAKKRVLSLKVLKENECPRCGYDSTKDLKGANELGKYLVDGTTKFRKRKT